MAGNGRLTTKQRRAVVALLGARDVATAAQVAKVGERSLRRWLKDDVAFRTELALAEQDVVTAATRKLSDLAWQAAAVLGRIMDDSSVPAGVRVRAADAILARLLQLKELMQLEQRLHALEASQEALREQVTATYRKA